MPLSSAGLTIQTVLEVLAQIEADQSAAFGDEVATGPASVLGQLNGVFAASVREQAELLQAVYASFDPDAAEGSALDRLAALTGTYRLPATFSSVEVDVTVADGTSLAPGELVLSVSGAPLRRFENVDQIDNSSGGNLVVPATFRAQESGPVEAPAGTLTVLAESAPGFVSATNAADAALGRDAETDVQLRTRREAELSRPGTGTVDAIRVDLLDAVVDADGNRLLVDVVVFENTSDVIDVDGLPPKAIEVVAYDGTTGGTSAPDADILQAVWDAKPGGILAHGTTTGTATDSRGDSRDVAFTRPTVVAVSVTVELEPGPLWVNATHVPILKAALAAHAQGLGIGRDVVLSRIYCVLFDAVEEGVIEDVSLIELNGGSTNVVIGSRQIASIDTGDVTITET